MGAKLTAISVFFFCCFLLGSMSGVVIASSEMWSQTYGLTDADFAYAVVETSDGGYAITGTTNSSGVGSFDFWLIKTDVNGNMLWNHTYGDDGSDVAYSLVETSDGGYAIAGSTWSFGAYTLPGGYGSNNFWLVKTDADGNIQWTKTYGGDYSDIPYSVVETSDGGYALAGKFSDGLRDDNYWLVKTDKNGTMQWNQTFGGAGQDIARSLVETSGGGFAVAGSTSSFGAGATDFWLVKTYANGTIQWNMTYGGKYTDDAHSLVETSEGGFAIAGTTMTGQILSRDFWLIKTDQNGVMQWNQTYRRAEDEIERAESLIETTDGGYVLAGEASPGFEKGDFWVVKTDANGKAEWNATYGGTLRDVPYSVIETSDGGYVLAGYTFSFSEGKHDFWMIKTDEYGVVPEFPSWIIVPFILTCAFIVVIYKTKLPKITN